MFRIVLACSGIPSAAGAEAASDIAAEFRNHRQWHENVACTWDGRTLRLQADNDFDSDGLAVTDELSDCLSAYVAEPFDGDIAVESIRDVRATSC